MDRREERPTTLQHIFHLAFPSLGERSSVWLVNARARKGIGDGRAGLTWMKENAHHQREGSLSESRPTTKQNASRALRMWMLKTHVAWTKLHQRSQLEVSVKKPQQVTVTGHWDTLLAKQRCRTATRISLPGCTNSAGIGQKKRNFVVYPRQTIVKGLSKGIQLCSHCAEASVLKYRTICQRCQYNASQPAIYYRAPTASMKSNSKFPQCRVWILNRGEDSWIQFHLPGAACDGRRDDARAGEKHISHWDGKTACLEYWNATTTIVGIRTYGTLK